MLLVDPDRVCFNPNADLWLDVAVFERALVRTRGTSGAALDAQQAQQPSRAAARIGDVAVDNAEGYFTVEPG